MRTQDIFGECRTFTAHVLRPFQAVQERKQAAAASVSDRISVTTVFAILVDIHISYPADAINDKVEQSVKPPPEFTGQLPYKPRAGTSADTMPPIIPNIRAGIRNMP